MSLKSKVLLLSTFHFTNPKKDLVKNNIMDILSVDSQEYLMNLCSKLASFNPDKVLLEFSPENNSKMSEHYRLWRQKVRQISHHEYEQIGFRVANLCGHESIFGFDEREIMWPGENLVKNLDFDKPLKEKFEKLVSTLEYNEKSIHEKGSLEEAFKYYNSKGAEKLNKSIYLLTNKLKAKDEYIGADANASWWHRNLRMYANIQRHAHDSERILVIAGQGHIALLRDFIALDPELSEEEVLKYL